MADRSVEGYAKVSRRDIARELGVGGVVEGSALYAGSRARITAQLILLEPERHVWADSFECDMHEILAAERRVARAPVTGTPGAGVGQVGTRAGPGWSRARDQARHRAQPQ
jgi:TolB-like protein